MAKKSFLFAAALLSALSTQVRSEIISVDGSWYQFDVDSTAANSGSLEWIDLDGNALHFDFTLSEAAYLNVVDGGFAGDRFNVFDNGNLLGQTSAAFNTYPLSVGINFDQAISNLDYSRGEFWLSAGNHSITGALAFSAIDDGNIPFNATVGALSLTAVPIPAAAWLFGSSCAFMGMLSRRRSANIKGGHYEIN